MPLMNWTEGLSVGIDTVDNQHKVLIGLINKTFESVKAGQEHAIIGEVLKELVEYTVYHFGTEEDLFYRYEYPDYVKHKKQHDELTAKTRALKDEYEAGKADGTIAVRTMMFLQGWLTGHIINSDKTYAPYLISKGVR